MVYIYDFSFVGPKREKNKYFKMNRPTKIFIFFLIIYFTLTYVSSFLLFSESLMIFAVVFGLYSGDGTVPMRLLMLVLVLSFSFFFFFFLLFQKCVLWVFCGCAFAPLISLWYFTCHKFYCFFLFWVIVCVCICVLGHCSRTCFGSISPYCVYLRSESFSLYCVCVCVCVCVLGRFFFLCV